MTITTQFVSMVQEKAMQGLILDALWLSIFFGLILAIIPIAIKTFTNEESLEFKPYLKLYIKSAILLFILLTVLQLPSTISTYRLWRDFPTQMIVEKLL